MLLIDETDPTPLYIKIGEAVRIQIEQGDLTPGDTITSVRNLAAQLHISPNTVIKAYDELEKWEVINLKKGVGAFVLARRKSCPSPSEFNTALEQTKSFADGLKQRGFKKDEIRRLLTAALFLK